MSTGYRRTELFEVVEGTVSFKKYNKHISHRHSENANALTRIIVSLCSVDKIIFSPEALTMLARPMHHRKNWRVCGD